MRKRACFCCCKILVGLIEISEFFAEAPDGKGEEAAEDNDDEDEDEAVDIGSMELYPKTPPLIPFVGSRSNNIISPEYPGNFDNSSALAIVSKRNELARIEKKVINPKTSAPKSQPAS